LTDGEVTTLKHLAQQGMGDKALKGLAPDLGYLEARCGLAIGGFEDLAEENPVREIPPTPLPLPDHPSWPHQETFTTLAVHSMLDRSLILSSH
jgi:hypothetical protein